jgi:probable F420-dependent oxidoreductase
MKVYAGMDPRLPLPAGIAHARRVEAVGYDGLHVPETVHDSLAVSLLVADHTERITIRTSVTLAFAHSPTLTAYAAWDLARFSHGRFQLGLGTQIRQNIEERYGMPWHDPVDHMREYLDVLDALYASFRTGTAPTHEGRHYRVTRMQPYFNPGPDPDTVAPPTYLGGVNVGICRLAGERAAGFVTHPTNSTPHYLETMCRPNLMNGAARAERELRDLELVCGTQVITGTTRSHLDAERERQRRLFAFLYSTPAYRPTLERCGFGDRLPRLQAMVRTDRWDDLAEAVTDDMLDAVVPVAIYDELPGVLLERFGALTDAILLPLPPDPADDAALAAVIAALQQA